MIVLDTHIWLRFILGDVHLRPELRARIEEDPGAVLIPSISLWEAILLGQRQRVILEPSPVKFVRKAVGAFPFQVAPLSSEIAILSRELHFGHDDPADLFIAATAYANDAPLATDDNKLRRLRWLKTI